MTPDDLTWLQTWYQSHCDGDWEHAYGIRVDTLDNPGWSVTIDLKGTDLEHEPMPPTSRDDGPDDWIRLEVKDGQFLGRGAPANLADILGAFRDWASATQIKRTGPS